LPNRFQKAFSKRFRRIITNSPDGVPQWLPQIESGDDFGLFKPTDAPWVVHADLTTLIGGIRALLMQALHPGSLAGVADHSRYEADPLGRLAGTTKWLTILTFGSTQAIEKESARVNAMHKKVVGSYEQTPGTTKAYAASDSDLLLWVHVAFTESFLVTNEIYGVKPIPGGPDNYVAQWSKAVVPLGLANAPKSKSELISATHSFDTVLRADQRTFNVVEFIKHPPLSFAARIAYAIMFNAAAVTIEPKYLKILGVKPLPKWIAIPTGRALLKLMRLALGGISPLEEAALARHARLKK
jgi:uncharacterized protein (DUF2236 family)